MYKTFISIFTLSFIAQSALADQSFIYEGKKVTYSEFAKSTTPPANYRVVDDLSKCNGVESVFHMSTKVFDVILLNENGKNGHVRAATYGEKTTWDIGYYQINDVNWKYLERYGITPYDIRWNACINQLAAAYVLKPFYDEARREMKVGVVNGDDPIKLLEKVAYILAGYNSRTPKYRDIYKQRFITMLTRNLFEGDTVSLW